MPKRKRTPKRPRDVSQLAKRIVDISTGQETDEVDEGVPARAKGGEARAQKLAPKKRKAIARKAARARWKKR